MATPLAGIRAYAVTISYFRHNPKSIAHESVAFAKDVNMSAYPLYLHASNKIITLAGLESRNKCNQHHMSPIFGISHEY